MLVDEAKNKYVRLGSIVLLMMAWRWIDTAIKNEGYCGLAGKEGAE